MPDTEKKLDTATLQEEFAQFLKDKGYEFSGVEVESFKTDSTDVVDETENTEPQKPIRKVSEELNERRFSFDVYTDTTTLMPGLVVYDIEKTEPTVKVPYVTYKPSPRIITGVHNNGVNKGTLFFTYSHKTVKSTDFTTGLQVVSDLEVLYSPLSKGQAEYICKLLNLQSKQTYKQSMIKQQIKERQK